MITFKYILIFFDLINLRGHINYPRIIQAHLFYPSFFGASISLFKVYPSHSQELAAVYKGGRQSIKTRANLYYPLVDWLEKHTLPDKRDVSKHWIFNKAKKRWYHLQWFCLIESGCSDLASDRLMLYSVGDTIWEVPDKNTQIQRKIHRGIYTW